MAIGVKVPYSPVGNTEGGVTPAEGVPANDELRVRADPNAFGANIGQGIQKVGAEGLDVSTQYAGLKAETEANQAELGYVKAQGDLKAKYSQYEGLQADAMRPKYEEESIALQSQFKNGLSPIAGRSFDETSRRTLNNDISEYSGYAAGQVKKANVDSFRAIGDLQIAKTGDPSYVMDDNRFMTGLGALRHANNAIADHMDLGFLSNGKDSATGLYTFPDTPQGKDAQVRYQQLQDTDASKYYMGAVKTLAATNPKAAADFIDSHQKYMPDLAKAEAQQYLAPKMINQNIDGAINQQDAQVSSGWQRNILSGSPDTQSDLIGTIRRSENFTGKVGRDSNGYNVINGVNEKSYPTEYASIKDVYDTKGKDAGDTATNAFYQKEIIDKYDIKSLPKPTQAIVADGLVNHGAGEFGQSLIQAAKNGSTPEQLIDMRRNEYQRLATADPAQYGANLKGWNARLDGLQRQQSGQPVYANQADYLEANKDKYVQGAVDTAAQQYPDNLAISQTARSRAELNINAQISNAKQALKSDTDTIQNAINGSMTKGKVPMTLSELSSIQNISPVLDRVANEQGEFYKSIETRIAKAAHSDTTQNSPNAYDAILTALDNSGGHDRQSRIEYLSKGLGSDNPGFSISQKDYNDAKPAIDLDNGNDNLLGKMKEIANANGNLDGKGQQRAVAWYNQAMTAWKANQGAGDKAVPAAEFFDKEKGQLPPSNPPSRIQQLQNVANERLKAGAILVTNPDGTQGAIPANRLDDALKAGYKRVQ